MKFDKEKMRLYAITDRHWLNGRSLKEVVKESLDGGVTFLQLRDKNSDDETFLQEAAELPNCPVSISSPLPGITLTSICSVSPPTCVQASPREIPISSFLFAIR